MMLKAYIRDPSEMFVYQSPLPRQSKYHNVVLAGDPASIIHNTVSVDWHNSTMKIFANTTDAINNVPSVPMCKLPFRTQPPSAEQCVREAFEFLQRGHSIHHTECVCLQLQRCTVGTTGQGRSIKDVERELAVSSLHDLVTAGGETIPLLEVLVRLAGMTLFKRDMLSSDLCCVPPEITTPHHILAASRALYPRPYITTETCLGGLASLEKKGVVRSIIIQATSPAQYAVFWRNTLNDYQQKTDADITSLWHRAAAAPPHRKRSSSAAYDADNVAQKARKCRPPLRKFNR